MVTNEFLNDYLFHYNPYEKMWYGFKREYASTYFNDRESIPKNELFAGLSSWEAKDSVIKNYHPQSAKVKKA